MVFFTSSIGPIRYKLNDIRFRQHYSDMVIECEHTEVFILAFPALRPRCRLPHPTVLEYYPAFEIQPQKLKIDIGAFAAC